MTDILKQVLFDFNKVIRNYPQQSSDTWDLADLYQDEDDKLSVGMHLGNRLKVNLFQDDGEWCFWVFRTTKDGELSKAFKRTMITLDIPADKTEDAKTILKEFMKAIVGVEDYVNCQKILESSPHFYSVYKPSILLALQKLEMPVPQPQAPRETPAEVEKTGISSDNKFGLVMLAFFVIMVIFLANGGSNSPDGCDFVPDPRGGYSDC